MGTPIFSPLPCTHTKYDSVTQPSRGSRREKMHSAHGPTTTPFVRQSLVTEQTLLSIDFGGAMLSLCISTDCRRHAAENLLMALGVSNGQHLSTLWSLKTPKMKTESRESSHSKKSFSTKLPGSPQIFTPSEVRRDFPKTNGKHDESGYRYPITPTLPQKTAEIIRWEIPSRPPGNTMNVVTATHPVTTP